MSRTSSQTRHEQAKPSTIVLFDIGRLLRIRQEKLMRGLQKAGAGRLLLILDYLLGKGEAISSPRHTLKRSCALRACSLHVLTAVKTDEERERAVGLRGDGK